MHGIKIGNAPCSWGTLEFAGLSGERVPYERMLDELAASGYTGTELGDRGYMPEEPEALHDALARRGLDLTGAFVPVRLKDAAAHAAGEASALQVASLLAAAARPGARPFLVLADENGTDPVRTRLAGRITPAEALSPAEWRTFAAGANRIAAAVREQTGLRTVFHHHCAGYVETPGEIATLLDLTDPALLGLVFDTGHYLYGAAGAEGAVEGLARFAARIWYVHLKDCDLQVAAQARAEDLDYFATVGRGLFCELGRGSVDFPAVAQWLRENAYTGYLTVEQDVLPGMGAPALSAARNRAYLRSIGL